MIRPTFSRLLLSAATILALAPAGIAEAQTTNNAPQAAAAPTDGPKERPWMNAALSPDQRTDLLLKQMTLAEKLQLTFGYFSTQADWLRNATKNWVFPKDGLPGSAGIVPGIARLGIPAQ